MARRMEPKDRDEIALEKKLIAARTLVGLDLRFQRIDRLNEIEARIKESHRGEVERGEVTTPVVPGADEILQSLGITGAPEEIEAGN